MSELYPLPQRLPHVITRWEDLLAILTSTSVSFCSHSLPICLISMIRNSLYILDSCPPSAKGTDALSFPVSGSSSVSCHLLMQLLHLV